MNNVTLQDFFFLNPGVLYRLRGLLTRSIVNSGKEGRSEEITRKKENEGREKETRILSPYGPDGGG